MTSLGLEVGGEDDEGSFLSRGLEVGGDEWPEDARDDACDRSASSICTALALGGKSCEGVVPRSSEHDEAWDG
jgi:hypothetical protein